MFGWAQTRTQDHVRTNAKDNAPGIGWRDKMDGGWLQLETLPTDAYATGQSLYALNQAGLLMITSPAYQKGVDFLLRTQYPDGSSKVATRSYPFQSPVNGGFPHKNNQFISAAGSNWATMALIPASK